ncbi:MAG: chitobiase/beta-hexosaminidase C-terminal domain-containing protein [Fibrobacter intestinalis]|uniref:chitobiase/beta-hexosaminidase C-terminal domain-containing protein n=1 Tax=Fibrobacter intestinalis TaxID=28122 RepID=UPI003F12100E
MKELQDAVQELTLTQDKSFNIAIDKGNNTDQQMMKKAGHVMGEQVREQFVPYSDKYILKKWSHEAGKAIELTAAATGNVIVKALLALETHCNNKFVPVSDRYVAMKFSDIELLRDADKWQYTDNYTEKFLVNGDVKKFGTLKIFGMPDDWFPEKVHAVFFQSKAVLAPMKIKDLRIKDDSEMINGDLLLGRFYFDAFVIGRRCDAVAVIVDKGYKAATPTITKGDTTTAVASTTSGANIYVTTDGSDPRYSKSRTVYSTAIANLEKGEVIKAVAENIEGGNVYISDVAEYTFE